jgi:transcriptional regulator with XRE-family HTH domain
MAFGEILRNARVQKGLTPSDVAESTHMLVQVVEGLEKEDFRRIAAPIYGRGFVKLYAELLGLDPEPLISDFMNLYSGARPPVVLTKEVEPTADPAPAPAPAPASTPTPAPASAPVPTPVPAPTPLAQAADDTPATVRVPQRQPMEPRPMVRSVPLPDDAEHRTVPPAEVPGLRAADEPQTGRASKKDFRPVLVVEPEQVYDETDDLDLFRAASIASQTERDADAEPAPAPTTAEAEHHPRTEPRAPVAHKGKLPIFQIGGRMDRDALPTLEDEEVHARRRARMQTFKDGVSRLKDGVGRRLPPLNVPRQIWVFGGLGVLMVVLMVAGITMLFKLTGSDVKTGPAGRFERAAPPPMYVD